MSPTANDAPSKRQLILDSAVELFGLYGFHAVTVPQIAKHAGVGAGTLYHYFGGKEDLVHAVYTLHKQRLIDAVVADFPHHLAPRQRFREMFMRFARFYLDNPKVTTFFHANNHTTYLDQACISKDATMQQWLFDFIARAQEEEAIKAFPPELMIGFVGGVFGGLLQGDPDNPWCFRVDDENLARAEQMAWEAVRR